MKITLFGCLFRTAVGSLVGCQSPRDDANPAKTLGITHAEIELLSDEQGKRIMRKKTIKDQDELNRLLRCFPGVGQGRSSNIAAGWKAKTINFFHRNQGALCG